MSQYFNQPFGVTWRKAVLSIPRLVPDSILYITSPEGPHPIIVNIPSRSTHLIPLYVFIPPPLSNPNANTSQNATTKLPVIIDFHGGGFVFGSCQEQAPFCSKLSRELNAITISVDYRLGPASQFPAAIEDAEDIVNAILDPVKPGYKELRDTINRHLKKNSRSKVEVDDSRIAISGFSSGGNLALNLGLSINTSPANAATMKEDWPSIFPTQFPRNIPLLLFFPSLDCTMLPSERPVPPGLTPKNPKNKSFLQTLDLESSVMRTYLPLDKVHHPRASPGLADLKNGGLHSKARMLLVLPELDTLASQSDVWVKKVAEEGRSAHLSVQKVGGVVHGWTQFPDSWLSEEQRRLKISVFDEARDFVAKSWSSES